ADLMSFDSYGIYKKVNSFVAENPSKKSKAGNPVDNLTPWDKAWKYYADKSEQFGDEASTEAYKYKPKQRFAMGFFDLDSGEEIVIDVSKKQAQALHGAIMKNEKRIDTFAFELANVSIRFSFFMIAPCNACACFLDTSITISSPLSRSKNPIAKRCLGLYLYASVDASSPNCSDLSA